jgi:hypothetical protein
MSDGFVNIWVEQRGKRFFTVMDDGNGKRTLSPPFRTARAANVRAEKALAALLRIQPGADVFGGDQQDAATDSRTASGSQEAPETRHEQSPEEPQA